MKNISVDIGTVSVEGSPRDGAAIGKSIEREVGRQLRDVQGNAQIGEAVAAAVLKALGKRG